MKNKNKDRLKPLIVEIVAERRGVSRSAVYKVIKGIRENEAVMADYVDMTLQANRLILEVKKLVPFNEN